MSFFTRTLVPQPLDTLAQSLCADFVPLPGSPPHAEWLRLTALMKRPMMVIENSDGVGSYYIPSADGGDVVVRPVVCDIAKAEAVTTDDTPDRFPLTDPTIVLVMARDDDLYEVITIGVIQTPPVEVTTSTQPDPQEKPPTGIGRNDVRRIARRGGTKRMRTGFTEEVNEQLREYLQTVIRDTAAIADMRGKKTVRLEDVLHVLSRRGHPMYT